ncbi:MAG TPA: VOC family protein [Acetobacteraceae bacterium]|nr:VOC family protein [Acetobacteraceae bacterium]
MDTNTGTLARVVTNGVAEVGLVVRDLDVTRAFYRDVIGLEVIARSGNAARLGAGGVPILDLAHRPDALPDDPREAGLFHTAFLMPSRAALADWLAHATERRIPLDGASDHGVSEAIYLSDPEGNGIEVYADRPRDRWTWEGDQIRMSTERLDLDALLADRSGRPWTGAPADARIGHVHLRVGDIAAATRFWTETVGLDVVRAGNGAVFLSTGRYHHHVACNVWNSRGAGRRNPDRAGLSYVAMHATGERDAIEDPWGTRIAFQSAS